MKKILVVLVLLVGAYFMGPKPEAPVLAGQASWTDIPDSAQALDAYIASKESKIVL